MRILLAIAVVAFPAIVAAPVLGQEKGKAGSVTIRLTTSFFEANGVLLHLRAEGKLFDIDGYRVSDDGLRKYLSEPGFLNKEKKLIINFKVDATKNLSVDQVKKTLESILDCLPSDDCIIEINLGLRHPPGVELDPVKPAKTKKPRP